MMCAMKDSGVEWIGKIPADWNYCRIKYNAYLKGRIGWQGLKASEFIDDGPYLVTGTDFCKGEINWDTCYHISPKRYDEAPEIHIKHHDLLITKDGTVGKVAYIDSVPGRASLNSHLLLIRPLNEIFTNRFLYWVIQSSEFEHYTGYSRNGTIMQSLSQEKINDFSFCAPSLPVQQRIADYLDDKCGKIDAYVDRQHQIIDKLTAYKQSVITEAVTKGLDPNVPMKDSGVEWIGKIPEYWSRIKLARVIRNTQNGLTRRDLSESSGQIVLKLKNINEHGNIIYDFINRIDMSDDEKEKFGLVVGDFLFVRVNGSKSLVGKCAIFQGSNEIVAYNDHIIRVRFINYCNKEFIRWQLLSESGKREIELHINTAAGQFTISGEGLRDIFISFPPMAEQQQIVAYLDHKCAVIDEAISKKQALIDSMEAYKKSLIYEVVTGKKEV